MDVIKVEAVDQVKEEEGGTDSEVVVENVLVYMASLSGPPPQNIDGKTILDSGASNMGRYMISEFKEYRTRNDIKVVGLDGQVRDTPVMGVTHDGIENVLYTPNIKYNIDSPYQLEDIMGYVKDRTIGSRAEKYVKYSHDGHVLDEKVYRREQGQPFLVRVAHISKYDIITEQVLNKMKVIHERGGHTSAKEMLELCDVYPAHILGYSRFDAKMYLEYGSCDGCLKGTTVRRVKDKILKLVFKDYHLYGNREGLHIDVMFINGEWAFLVVKSHQFDMLWIGEVGVDYNSEVIKEALEVVFGDYIYSDRRCSFIRCDADTRFEPLDNWLLVQGIRLYMSPRGVKATKAELAIRRLKEKARTILFSMEYVCPADWVPHLMYFCAYLETIRYKRKLQMSPRQAFFLEDVKEYKSKLEFHFGDILAYTDTETSSHIYRPRVHFGAVVGVDHNSGNLKVINLRSQVEEKITTYESRVKVDAVLKRYFRNYKSMKGFSYSPEWQSDDIAVNTSDILLQNPYSKGPLESSGQTEVRQINLEIYTLRDGSGEMDALGHINPQVTRVETLCHSSTKMEDYETESSRWVGDDRRPPTHNSIELRTVDSRENDRDIVSDTIDSSHSHSNFNHNILYSRYINEEADIDKVSKNVIGILNSLNIVVEDDESAEVVRAAVTNISTSLSDGCHMGPISEQIEMLSVISSVVQLSHRQVVTKRPVNLVDGAGMGELRTVSDRDTIVGVHKKDIPVGVKILYLMVKYSEKFKDGIFLKVKARLLLGGDLLKHLYGDNFDEISSRTVSMTSLFTLFAIAAREEMDTFTMDFMNAFLYATLEEKDWCYARVPETESQLLVRIDSSKWSKFYNQDDKCIYVQIRGALYGHPLAPKLWYNFMTSKLAIIGFRPLKADVCVYVRDRVGLPQDKIGGHVDDLFMASKDPKFYDEMIEFRRVHFRGEGTIEKGPRHDFLAMSAVFDKVNHSVFINQTIYWQKVCTKFELMVEDVSKMPHRSDYLQRMRDREIADLGPDNKILTKYLSVVMSMMWGVKRSRPDLLANITSLATHSRNATMDDFHDAMQVLKFINGTKDEGITLKINGEVRISVFVDSSSGAYSDTRGHGGHVISLGSECYGGPIEVYSGKAGQNQRSVMEYELMSFHKMLPSVEFLKEFLEELGYEQKPAIIFEDNRALIEMLKRGKISTGVTRHIAARYYYGKDLMDRGVIVIRHCPTLLMIADILTKTLAGKSFQIMSKRIRNSDDQHESVSDDVYRKLYADSIIYDDPIDQQMNLLLVQIMRVILEL